MGLENFTTYTEVDPGGNFTVTAPKIVTTLLPRDVDAYVYDDKGVGHFDGNFDHLVDSKVVSGPTNYTMHFWHLANVVDDWWGQFAGNKDFLGLYWVTTASSIRLIECDGGTLYTDSSLALSFNTYYYFIISRDESIGTYGQLKCEIFSDIARTVLVETLTVALHSSKKDFQYIYGAISLNNATTGVVSGESENLDLQEGGVISGFPFFFDAGHY
jgi:hypothetical protein